MFDDEVIEANAERAEAEWRDRHLSMLDDVLKAIGPGEVLRHTAGFLERPTPFIKLDEAEPF